MDFIMELLMVFFVSLVRKGIIIMVYSRYTPEEILQILKDFYNFQSVFDPEVSGGEELSFKTSVWEWMSICDLVGPRKLATAYYKMFDLTAPVEQLEILLRAEESTLEDFCNYIAANASRQIVEPVMIMETRCETAAIFKTLMWNLSASGVDTKNIKPSSSLEQLFFAGKGGEWIQEVSKLAPGTLTDFEYEPHQLVHLARYIMIVFLIEIVVIPLLWHFSVVLLAPLALSIVLLIIGERLKPVQSSIGGYETVRGLIEGMQKKIDDQCRALNV